MMLAFVMSFLLLWRETGAWIFSFGTSPASFPLRRIGLTGQSRKRGTISSRAETVDLRMSLLDTISDFIESRKGDFVRLEETPDGYGPGPLLILYRCPEGVEDDEVRDMIHDGAPEAHRRGCKLVRIDDDSARELDLPLEEALKKMATKTVDSSEKADTSKKGPPPGSEGAGSGSVTPVLFFSGFQSGEMLRVYDILAREIYEEVDGTMLPACAKAVPNAMAKPLRQVLDEVSSDHEDAMKLMDA